MPTNRNKTKPIQDILYVAFFEKAQSLQAKHDWEGAIQAYLGGLHHVASLYPQSNDHAYCRTNLGLVYMELKQYDKALPHLTKSFEIRQAQAVNHQHGKFNMTASAYNLGFCELQMDRLDNALQRLELVLEVSNSMTSPVAKLALKAIEQIHIKREDKVGLARCILRQMQDMNLGEAGNKIQVNTNDAAYVEAGKTAMGLYAKGAFDNALEHFKRALKTMPLATPDHGLFLCKIGEIYMQQGKLPEAQIFIQNAIDVQEEIGHPIPIALSVHNLANIHHQTGDNDQAIRYMTKVINLCTNVKGGEVALFQAHVGIANIISVPNPMLAQQHLVKANRLQEYVKDNIDLQIGLLNAQGLNLMARGAQQDARTTFLKALEIVKEQQQHNPNTLQTP